MNSPLRSLRACTVLLGVPEVCFLAGGNGSMACVFIYPPLVERLSCLGSYKKLLLTFVYKLSCGHMFSLPACVFSYEQVEYLFSPYHWVR